MNSTDPETDAILAGAEIEKPARARHTDDRPTTDNSDSAATDEDGEHAERDAGDSRSALLTTDAAAQEDNSVINPENS